ncbi:MAG: hypothetical protein IID16_01025 [Candidatus Marinimicrobia bacterium]|nr:hypothetical protein [Candidatus Neomarinimicrobiota bacterium]
MNNFNLIALESAARIDTNNSEDLTNSQQRGCHVIIDVTAINASPSVIPKIQGKDSVSGKYYDLLTGTAITGTGTTVLKVYPGITVATNVSVSDILPVKFRILMTHGNADSITYSVGVNLV